LTDRTRIAACAWGRGMVECACKHVVLGCVPVPNLVVCSPGCKPGAREHVQCSACLGHGLLQETCPTSSCGFRAVTDDLSYKFLWFQGCHWQHMCTRMLRGHAPVMCLHASWSAGCRCWLGLVTRGGDAGAVSFCERYARGINKVCGATESCLCRPQVACFPRMWVDVTVLAAP
jgi:hypothetical protein